MKKAEVGRLSIDRFDYPLPDEKIAKYPLQDRDASKLLVYDGDGIRADRFHALADYLPADSLLLFNNTRVIHARLIFKKATGARVEVFCLTPHDPADYVVNFQQRGRCSWNCMIGNARRWKDEALSMEIPMGEEVVELRAEKRGTDGEDTVVAFSWEDGSFSFRSCWKPRVSSPFPRILTVPRRRATKTTTKRSTPG